MTGKTARMRLRPYHPTWLIGYFGLGGHPQSYNSRGFNELIERIRSNPEIEVEFIEEFDDICAKCERLEEDESGSVWGAKHSCQSSRSADVVRAVQRANKRVLDALDLGFGSVVALRDLVALLSRRLPVLDDAEIGGAGFQEEYEKGLEVISRLWQQTDQ